MLGLDSVMGGGAYGQGYFVLPSPHLAAPSSQTGMGLTEAPFFFRRHPRGPLAPLSIIIIHTRGPIPDSRIIPALARHRFEELTTHISQRRGPGTTTPTPKIAIRSCGTIGETTLAISHHTLHPEQAA